MAGGSNKPKKGLIIAGALAAAFGMGLLAYHELNTRVLAPTRSIIMRNEASGPRQQEEEAVPKGEAGKEAQVGKEAESDTQERAEDVSVGGAGMAAEGDAAGETSFIGEESAMEAALAHANVAQEDTSYLECHVDYEEGRAKCYAVEFQVGNTEYEYEIDLYDGSILESSMDANADGRHGNGHKAAAQTDGTYIGGEAAWAKALAHAGVEESEVTGKEVELDGDDGRMVYEIEFDAGRTEYEYEIDAVSGEILKWDEKRRDSQRG